NRLWRGRAQALVTPVGPAAKVRGHADTNSVDEGAEAATLCQSPELVVHDQEHLLAGVRNIGLAHAQAEQRTPDVPRVGIEKLAEMRAHAGRRRIMLDRRGLRAGTRTHPQ